MGKSFFSIDISKNNLYTLQKTSGLTKKEFTKIFKQQIKRLAGTARKIIREQAGTKIKTKNKKWIGRRVKAKRIKIYSNNGEEEIIGGLWVGCNPLSLGDFKGKPQQTKEGLNFNNKFYAKSFIIKKNNSSLILKRVNGKLEIIKKDIEETLTDILFYKVTPVLKSEILSRVEKEIKRRLKK